MQKILAAAAAMILASTGAFAQANDIKVGQRALVTEDTSVVVAASSGVIRRKDAGDTCSLRKGQTIVFIAAITASEPQQVVAKRIATPTLGEIGASAKKGLKQVISPKQAAKDFMATCAFIDVFVPRNIFDKWVHAQNADDARIAAEAQAKNARRVQR